MRWLGALGLVTLVACGGEDRPVSTAEQTPQPLEIPPLDAGAQERSSAAAVTQAPPAPVDPQANPNEIAERDRRAVRTSIRSEADVAAQIQGLEQIINSLPVNDSKLPVVLRRVADNYEELATVSGKEAVVRPSRRKEADHLGTLINGFPAFVLLDEARYFRALSFERLGDLRNARATYYDLIKHHPTSRYIPHAYFAFGELFFAEAKSDPSKWDLAKQAFMETLKYPPPANDLFPFALLRMGEVALAQGDAAKAKSNFDRLRHDFPTSAAVQRIP